MSRMNSRAGGWKRESGQTNSGYGGVVLARIPSSSRA
jgi:hypothetical protein